ncbi:unnamed protein product [Strongylus vulgaris]|uniref:Uncharacterized protein n=1 Tax=Strongylus vulgaris TaxID=40348 RepID=A0A3P7IEX9_STRVU|nr:unnamed protein product [Strongylus vulgaris]
MEVRCWGELLNRTENDAQISALLVAFPLFDALFKADSPESSVALCAMATEWITNAILLDYKVRVRTVRFLARWAALIEKSSLGLKLGSIAAHFQQYIVIIEQKLREAREPVEFNLRDYVKIVKYNDLNLWNIKVSSQKAHTHLFKVVRKFKEAVGLQVAQYFDMLLDINVSELSQPSVLFEADFEGRVRRAKHLAADIVTHGKLIACFSIAQITGFLQQKSMFQLRHFAILQLQWI